MTAVASRSGGGTVTTTSTFRTLTPSRTFTTEILEGYNQTYGVGMPIILYFSQPITDKAAVERALQITTSKPVVGAWYWDEPCNMAPTCAYFRPRDYWPTGTTISFTGHLNGVQGAPGMYGAHTLTQTFDIGASLVAIGNTATHSTQIYYNGKLRYNWPISSGRPGDDTPDGSYLTIEKANPVQMTGPGYSLSVPWSVRFTFSGDYYHDAYWSVGEQGFENVSHGCVNLSPADAETYYNLAVPGDPITITGSPKAAPGTTAGPSGSSAGRSTSRAAHCTRPCRPGRAAARSSTLRRCPPRPRPRRCRPLRPATQPHDRGLWSADGPGSASGQPGHDVLGDAVQPVEVTDHLHAIAQFRVSRQIAAA